MSTDSLSVSPVGFTLFTVVASALSFAIGAIYGSLALIFAYSISEEHILFAIIFLIAFSLAKSQDVVKNREMYGKPGDVSRLYLILGLAMNVVYINIVLLVVIFVGGELISMFGAENGLFAAAVLLPILGFWEIETRSRSLPISVGGLMIWAVAFTYILYAITSTFLGWIKSGDTSLIVREIVGTMKSVLRVMGASEETPVYGVAKKFTR